MAPTKEEGHQVEAPAAAVPGEASQIQRDTELSDEVRKAVADKKTTRRDLAAAMGIAIPTLAAFITGRRSWAALRAEPLRALAAGIGRPPLWVFLRAGRIAMTDFFVAPAQATVQSIYEEMLCNPEIAAFVPKRSEWEAMSEELRQTFILMFRAAVAKAHQVD